MGNVEVGNRSEQGSTAPELRSSALRWRQAFLGDDARISTLRRWLEYLLPPCPSRDDLMSVAVELGTNAVRHTASGNGGRFVVEVTWWIQMIRIAVYDDGSPDHPRVTEDPLCEDGRGLLMVSALSARMGVGGNEKGRVVWADIPWIGQTTPSQLELPEGRVRGPRCRASLRRDPSCSISATYQDLPRVLR